jgi:hypothetical protein
MGNPRSPRRTSSRLAHWAVAKAPLRTLAITAAVASIGISFALVADAVSALNSSNPSAETGLAGAYVQGGSTPLALGEPGANTTSPAADPVPAAAPPSAGNELSKAQAIALVQGRYRARVVRSTVSQDKSGRRLYVFRLLSGSGKVWTVRIDAQTGAEVP